jgi:hypothetical protein
MATIKQIQANRRNAQLSTGPRTETGKAVSRLNALKSGIDARNEAASGEDPAALQALTEQYDSEFQPLGVVERFLVDILIKNDWFLRRYRFLAADLVNASSAAAYEARKGADFGAGFAANTNSFHRLHRHIAETERSFFTHLAELERRQAARRQLQADDPDPDSPHLEDSGPGFVPPANPTAVSHSSQTPKATIGFVPHSHQPVPKHTCESVPVPTKTGMKMGPIRCDTPNPSQRPRRESGIFEG